MATDVSHFEPADPYSGKPPEFMRLYLAHQRQIYAFIGTFLRDSSDIDEVLQETSIVLWKKFHEFRLEANFLNWAFGIARLEVLRYVRSTKKEKFSFTDDLIDLLAAERACHAEHLERRREALALCLEKLSRRDRALIEDCYRPDTLVKQVAEQINRPVNAVYQSLSRIRRWLLQCINNTLAVQEE